MPTNRPRVDTAPSTPLDAKAALRALSAIPRGLFVMTAAYDGHRTGLRVNLVQVAATEPPSISISLPKGQPISPLIRDSRAFGLCFVPTADAFLTRRFLNADHDTNTDPFDAIDTFALHTGSPLIKRSPANLDCSVAMHIDFESDHEIYIANIVAAKIERSLPDIAQDEKPVTPPPPPELV